MQLNYLIRYVFGFIQLISRYVMIPVDQGFVTIIDLRYIYQYPR